MSLPRTCICSAWFPSWFRTDNLVMIKAQPGTASGIAAAVDAAELPDVLGSLAGNDTILVIAQTAEDGERLEALINKLSNSHK